MGLKIVNVRHLLGGEKHGHGFVGVRTWLLSMDQLLNLSTLSYITQCKQLQDLSHMIHF